MHRLMIIPAAGAGSRLKTSLPKVLVPVNGRPMIDHLLDLHGRFIDRFVVVLQPSACDDVRRHCAASPFEIEFAVQESPTGMLDAILIPRERVAAHRPDWIWITWADQVGVDPKTIDRLAQIGDEEPDQALIFPTVQRANPYTHLVRNAQGDIVHVLHRREGDDLPASGESEMGLFSVSRDAYLSCLLEFAMQLESGAHTGERNFVPFIPWISRRAPIRTFPAQHELEAVGINTPEELELIEEYLRNRTP